MSKDKLKSNNMKNFKQTFRLMFIAIGAVAMMTSCGPSASEIEAKVKAALKNQQDSIASSEKVKADSIVAIEAAIVENQQALSQVQTSNLKANKTLLPQLIDYDGKPDLEYTMNNKIIALDGYNENDSEGSYIRMKFNNKEVLLKMQKQNTSKLKRVYSNNEYTVTFYEIVFGAYIDEVGPEINGKLLIQTKSEQNTILFKGSDIF